MSQVIVCRICLRIDVGARDIPEVLVDLHDEICDYDVSSMITENRVKLQLTCLEINFSKNLKMYLLPTVMMIMLVIK